MTYINRKRCAAYTNEELLAMLRDSKTQKAAIGCIYLLAQERLEWMARNYGLQEKWLDIANDGVIILIEKIEQNAYDPASNLVPFYIGICRFLMLGDLRDQKRRAKGNAAILDNDPTWAEVPSPEDIRVQIEDIKAHQDQLDQLAEKMKKLTDICKKVFRLRHWEKDENGKRLSWAAIASQMGHENAQVSKNTYGRCKKGLID